MAYATLTVGTLVFDAWMDESHTSDSEVTEHPIEDGSPVSDHKYDKADELVLQLSVTDTPFRLSPTDPFLGSASRSVNAFALLKKAKTDGTLLAIQTLLELYQNMVVKTIKVSKNKSTANVGKFNVTFRKMNIVSTQTATYTAHSSLSSQTSATVASGNQSGTPGGAGTAGPPWDVAAAKYLGVPGV